MDANAHAAFERVAQKCLHLAQRPSLDSGNCSVHEEELGPADLEDLVVYHERCAPLRDYGKLVIIDCGGQRTVIDGNNRVNLWRKTGHPGPFPVIIVSPQHVLT